MKEADYRAMADKDRRCCDCGSAVKVIATPHQRCRDKMSYRTMGQGRCPEFNEWAKACDKARTDMPRSVNFADLQEWTQAMREHLRTKAPCPCDSCETPTVLQGGIWAEIRRRADESDEEYEERTDRLENVKLLERKVPRRIAGKVVEKVETYYAVNVTLVCKVCRRLQSDQQAKAAFAELGPFEPEPEEEPEPAEVVDEGEAKVSGDDWPLDAEEAEVVDEEEIPW